MLMGRNSKGTSQLQGVPRKFKLRTSSRFNCLYMENSVETSTKVASASTIGTLTGPAKVPGKRLKKDPPSPPKIPSSVTMDLLLEEIRALRPFVEETNSKIQILTDSWSNLEQRVGVLEQTTDSLASSVAKVDPLCSQVVSLQKQIENLENRSRRNNLRIYGLAEGTEGSDPIAFFQSFIPKLLKMPEETRLNIQRVHRLGSSSSLASSTTTRRPRGVIMYLLEYTDLTRILTAARALKRITWSGQPLFFTQDYAKSTADRRRDFLALRPQLRSIGARYGLFHPCLFKVTINNKTTTYEDPLRLKSFLYSFHANSMDTSSSTS